MYEIDDADIHRIGFEIGWDHARYNVIPSGELDKCVSDGITAGQLHFGKNTMHHNRFIRKWLLLRLNAFKRKRVFDSRVTPEYLEQIDVTHCPITLVKLTHGQMAETDWSIDRIDNDAGYIPGNLIVTSSKRGLPKTNAPPAGLTGYNPIEEKIYHADICPQSSLPHSPSGLSE